MSRTGGGGLNDVREVAGASPAGQVSYRVELVLDLRALCWVLWGFGSLRPSTGGRLGHQQLHFRWKGTVPVVRECPSLGSLAAELEKRSVGRRSRWEVVSEVRGDGVNVNGRGCP